MSVQFHVTDLIHSFLRVGNRCFSAIQKWVTLSPAGNFTAISLPLFTAIFSIACQTASTTEPTAIETSKEPPATTTSTESESQSAPRPIEDPHSYSKPEEVQVLHIGANWQVDFQQKKLHGIVRLLIERHESSAPLRLDTRSLEIQSVAVASVGISLSEQPVRLVLDNNNRHWQSAEYRLGTIDPILGQELQIELGKLAQNQHHQVVEIQYSTSPLASGLQWLSPEQTANRARPFLYSQSQAIHARSWLPCQDSPGVRITFDAKVRVPPGFTAVMAANMLDEDRPLKIHTTGNEEHIFRFEMPQKIPVYLMAIAVGDLRRAKLGPRSWVWADPFVIPRARHEFAEMESWIVLAEDLFGPYPWERYDILVLPPAFPMGGMENPRLTFATPTILAGDRSLISLIAHELAHSWSGNLVTNATWGDMWLNEGFTTYAERRLLEARYGTKRESMEAMLGRQDLEREIHGELADQPTRQTLRQDLKGLEPDDAFSNIPYEKGALFLQALEQSYGRTHFDQFLRSWFRRYQFSSVSTEMFLKFLHTELIGKYPILDSRRPVDIQAWVDQPGMPKNAPQAKTQVFSDVDTQATDWLAKRKTASQLNTHKWNAHQWLHFLRALPTHLSREQMSELDSAFSFTQSNNSEILAQWLVMVATSRYESAYQQLNDFLHGVGRQKFLIPIYKALLENSDGTQQARTIYESARSGYHSITKQSLDTLLLAPKNTQ